MHACGNLDRLNQNVSNAVKVRRELDLRIGGWSRWVGQVFYWFQNHILGATFTRFQTKLLTKAFPSVLSEQLVSYGPCQFPTLGFVVERVSVHILNHGVSSLSIMC